MILKIEDTLKYKFAKLISRIFDGPVAIFIIMFLVWYKAPLEVKFPFFVFLLITLTLIIGGIVLILVFIRIKLVDNWELTNKNKRKYVFILIFITISFMLAIGYINNISGYYLTYLIIWLIIFTIYALITEYTKYKPSLHIGYWTAILYILITTFSPVFILLSPILFIIGYARIVIKNHNVLELFLGGVIIILVFSVFSLIFLH